MCSPKRLLEVIVTLLAVAVASCGYNGGKEKKASPAPVKEDITAEARHWADSVSRSMDTARLASQVLMPALFASDDYWTVRQLRDYASQGIGGIILLKGSVEGASALADSLTRLSAVMPFVSIDAEWGLNMRLVDAPKFPANGRLSPKVEDQLMYDYGREVARECRLLGINMVLGPVLDVSLGNLFIGSRSFGADPERVAQLGTAYGHGVTDGNVLAVAKHFPGHGTVRTDSHLGKGVIDGSLQRLDTVDLVPFRAWINEGLPAVMVGHLAVPAIDSDMLPAAVSPTVIGDLLRRDLGFHGLVLTDALNMSGAEGYGADKALLAGADLILAPADTRREHENIIAAVRSGALTLSSLREHVARILFYKYLYSYLPSREDPPLSSPHTDTLATRLKAAY